MDLSDLNKQLQFLTNDYQAGQQVKESREVIQRHAEELNRTNDRLLERQYQTFNPKPVNQPRYNQQMSNQVYTNNQQHNSNNIQSQQYTRQQPNNYQQHGQQLNNYQQNGQQSNNYQQSNYQQYQHNKQVQQQQLQQQQAQDLRVQMNNQMDTLRFDNQIHMNRGLVPVDMDHIYSGNIFQDGTPIPQDILVNNPQAANNIQQHSSNHKTNSRILLQNKSKTAYRNDFNDRLEQLSPFNQQLFQPIHQRIQPTQDGGVSLLNNPMSSHTIKNDRYELKKNIRDDMNSRLSQFSALSSNKPLPDGKTVKYSDPTYIPNPNQDFNPSNGNNGNIQNRKNNQRSEKLPIQELMPVMSNY